MLLSLFLQTALQAPAANSGALRDHLGALLEPLAAIAAGAQPDLAAASPQDTMVLTAALHYVAFEQQPTSSVTRVQYGPIACDVMEAQHFSILAH